MSPQKDIMEMFFDCGKPIGRALHLTDLLNRARFGEYMVIASVKMLVHHQYLTDLGKGYYALTKTGAKAIKRGAF